MTFPFPDSSKTWQCQSHHVKLEILTILFCRIYSPDLLMMPGLTNLFTKASDEPPQLMQTLPSVGWTGIGSQENKRRTSWAYPPFLQVKTMCLLLTTHLVLPFMHYDIVCGSCCMMWLINGTKSSQQSAGQLQVQITSLSTTSWDLCLQAAKHAFEGLLLLRQWSPFGQSWYPTVWRVQAEWCISGV